MDAAGLTAVMRRVASGDSGWVNVNDPFPPEAVSEPVSTELAPASARAPVAVALSATMIRGRILRSIGAAR